MRSLADVEEAGAGGEDVAQLLQHELGEALHALRGAAHADEPHVGWSRKWLFLLTRNS